MRIYLSKRLDPRLCPPGVEGGGIILETAGWFFQVKARRWGWKPWTWRYAVAEGRCFWAWGPFLVKLPPVSNGEAVAIPFGEWRTSLGMKARAEGFVATDIHAAPVFRFLSNDPDPVITGEQLRDAARRAADGP